MIKGTQYLIPVISRGLAVARISSLRFTARAVLRAIKYCVPLILLAGPAGAVIMSTYSFNSGMNCNGVWRLPDTGQTASYTATLGEDHDYQPAAVQMSYTDNGNGTVTDNVTGLMWIKDPVAAGRSGTYTWEGALTACEGLTYAGFSDWRLPNVRELASIVYFGTSINPRVYTAYFVNTQAAGYWSSTSTNTGFSDAFCVYFTVTAFITVDDMGDSRYVRCVRAGPY